MGFIRFDKEGRMLDKAGNPVHLVGVNYVASYVCTNFWEDWRPKLIEKDLARIAGLGLQAVRIPMHWGTMEPLKGQYNKDFEEKFACFVDMCRRYELYIMPWFLVGVATESYDVPFRNGCSFFEEEMTEAAENHLKHFIAPYRDEEWILFWDICDEPEWYSKMPGADKLPYHRGKTARWVKHMYDAVKSVDPNHMVTLGFGHIATENYGMDIRDMAKILDLMVVTAYPYYQAEGLDTARNNYAVPFHVKMNACNTPVFTCEAPGMSSVLYSEEMLGRYFKTSLYSNWVNGSTGVLPWVYNDFEETLWHEPPLEWNLPEAKFGIVTTDGRLKPSGEELQKFAALAQKEEIGRYCPKKAQTAILIPEGYYPGIRSVYDRIITSYMLVKGCSADVDLVWSTDDFSDYKLLLVPSAAGMTTSVWDKVRHYVEEGGMLYHPYEGNSCNVYFNELFGVEVQTDEKDYGYEQMTAAVDWGCWKKGDVYPFTGAERRKVLRVHPESAQTLFAYEDGEPAFLRHTYGKGICYLAASALDSGLRSIPYREYLKTGAFALLDTLMEEAGVERIVRVDHPAVETGCMVDCDTGVMLAVIISHDNRPVKAELKLELPGVPESWKICDTETGEILKGCTTKLSLEPAGVVVYKLERL